MLKLWKVRKEFARDGEAPVVALDGVDLELREREFCVIVGDNGSGKSTLLRLIAGDYEPDGGAISWADQPLSSLPAVDRRRWFFMVHQNPADGTAPTLTVAENLSLASLVAGRAGIRRLVTASRRARVRTIVTGLGVGLEGREDAMVKNLSGGQRQALAVYMAVLRQPRVLLLDEHTSALDPDRAEAVRQLTLQLWKEQALTVLMVTHNMSEAADMGNRLVCLSEGRVILDVAGREKSSLGMGDIRDLSKRTTMPQERC